LFIAKISTSPTGPVLFLLGRTRKYKKFFLIDTTINIIFASTLWILLSVFNFGLDSIASATNSIGNTITVLVISFIAFYFIWKFVDKRIEKN
jgi:hypothetical protein